MFTLWTWDGSASTTGSCNRQAWRPVSLTWSPTTSRRRPDDLSPDEVRAMHIASAQATADVLCRDPPSQPGYYGIVVPDYKPRKALQRIIDGEFRMNPKPKERPRPLGRETDAAGRRRPHAPKHLVGAGSRRRSDGFRNAIGQHSFLGRKPADPNSLLHCSLPIQVSAVTLPRRTLPTCRAGLAREGSPCGRSRRPPRQHPRVPGAGRPRPPAPRTARSRCRC